MYGEWEISIYVHDRFLKWVTQNRRRNGDFIRLRVAERMLVVDECDMEEQLKMKEFAARIVDTGELKGRVDFVSEELCWDENELIYRPLQESKTC